MSLDALFALDPAGYRPHGLHALSRRWPETNCYVDLWIEVIAALGHAPEAMLGFTVTQDFEGDQFSFFKPPLEDLETLYGVRVQELSIFDRLDGHVGAQLARRRLVLVEVDGFYLPDTRGVSYRSEHTKTTIGITALDPAGRRLRYFHNAGFFGLEAEDFDGVFGAAGVKRDPADLFPYVEFAKLADGAPAPDPRVAARGLLARHLGRRPSGNPIGAYGGVLARDAADLATREPGYFNAYAFNSLRQLGANFELLASHLDWLEPDDAGLDPVRAAALAIADGAKTMQFKLARAMAKNRYDGLESSVEPMASAYASVMAGLDARYGQAAGDRIPARAA